MNISSRRWLAPFLDVIRFCLFAALPLAGLLIGPAYASLAWTLAAIGLLSVWLLRRPVPAPNFPLAAVGACFCALCVLSVAWSIAPQRSLLAAGQLAIILAASLVILADRSITPAWAGRAFGAMSLALFAGVGVMCVDRALHFPLQHHLAPRELYPATKYNRGEDYLTLLLWPLLAFWVLERRYARAAAVILAVLVAAAIGQSTTARITLPLGLLTLCAARVAPRATLRTLRWGSFAMIAALPFILRGLAADRAVFWRYLKQSGLHRLEIWDYMTARVFEHPWLGWGFATAKLVPIRAAEQRAYAWVDPHGVYPHNQVLQLWLETGAAGAALGLVFVMLVLNAISSMPPRLYPFACAAYAAALAVSASSFELTTDSWWAALALTACLLRLAGEVVLL